MRELSELENDMTSLYKLIKGLYNMLDELNIKYNALRIELNSHK